MHARQHGGWGRQASRRGKKLVACTHCGMPAHPRIPRQQATPVEPEEQWGPVKLIVVSVFAVAFLWAIGLWAGIGYVVPA